MPSNKNAHKDMFPHSTTRARGRCQKCCISLCSKVFINHIHQMKASSECLNILMYWSKYWVDRLRRTLRRKVLTGIFFQQIYRLCHYILHQVAHIDCSAPSGKQHEPSTGVCVITWPNFDLSPVRSSSDIHLGTISQGKCSTHLSFISVWKLLI